MLVRHFKNHSPTPQKYVRVNQPTFANGGAQRVPLEVVGERVQMLATCARVERTPVLAFKETTTFRCNFVAYDEVVFAMKAKNAVCLQLLPQSICVFDHFSTIELINGI